MENVRRHIPFFSRRRWGVKNLGPWSNIFHHTFHQFHENDLFTPAAAMSYFGLLTLFPALILLLSLGKRLAAGSDVLNEMLRRVAQAYPGSGEFLDTTIRSLSDLGTGVIISCVVSSSGPARGSSPSSSARSTASGTRPRARSCAGACSRSAWSAPSACC